MNIIFFRYYKYSSWMLACSSFNTCTTFNQPVGLCVCSNYSLIIKILFYITICCLLCYSTYSSCPKDITLTKKLFCKLMYPCLIFTRKIQVNIRYLVPVKAHKDLKGNIISELHIWGITDSAVFIG